jgi:glycerol-3-phosphate dehydrogenase
MVYTSGGMTITAALAVNATGLWADEVSHLAGDNSFAVLSPAARFSRLYVANYRRLHLMASSAVQVPCREIARATSVCRD